MRRWKTSVSIVLAVLLGALTGAAPASAVYEYAGAWGEAGAAEGQFADPAGIAIDQLGNVYVADSGNHRVQKFNLAGGFIGAWGTPGSGDGEFAVPGDVAADALGNVYVLDSWNNRVQKFRASGAFVTKWGSQGSGPGEFDLPVGIAVGPDGNVYVADTFSHRIPVFDPNSNFITQWQTGADPNPAASYPTDVAVSAEGDVYVVDGSLARVAKFSADGTYLGSWGQFGSGPGQLNQPNGIALDPAGSVFVADYGNDRVLLFGPLGDFVASWGSFGSGPGEFQYPVSLAVAPNGDVYVSDEANQRIQRFRRTEPETTIDSGPTGKIADPTPDIEFSSSVPGSVFECRVLGMWPGWQPCTSPWSTPPLDDGLNVVRVRATDPHGLTDSTPAEIDFRVDTTAPATTIKGVRVKGRKATATFAASERDSTFECKLDRAKWTQCSSPYKTGKLKRGKHTLRVRATDSVGNRGTPAAKRFRVK